MIHVPELDLSTGEKTYQKCPQCESIDVSDAFQEKDYHDPRCPEVCRNKEVGRAAWMRGKADAEMHQHHSGESYNGQYELGHELASLSRFWKLWVKRIKHIDITRGPVI